MRAHTLLLASVALLGASVALSGAAAPQALAAPSAATLEVNENCVEAAWPCWTTDGAASRPQPTLSVMIASGGTVTFVDHGKEANIAWNGTPAKCEPTVPIAPTLPKTGWEGKCTFETAGIYKFESTTLFNDGYNNYTKYEVVVQGTPTDKTTSASGETQTEATLNGSIDPEGNSVQYRFEYEGPGVAGKQSTPTATLTADFTSHPVSAQVTGLEPGMTYHFQLVATYEAGKTTVSGATQQAFTTHTATAPTATTLAAEGLKETEATLKGTVDTGGEATEYFFEYGTGPSYGQTTQKATLPASGGNQTVSATLIELTPGTEYHFRLVAKNKSGSMQGTDLTFKTASTPSKEPTKEPPAKEPSPTPTPIPMPGPISPEPEIAPLVPALVGGSLKLTAPRHGSSVRGSVVVSKSGAGGRLEVDLLAKPSALGARGSKLVLVARFVRGSVSSGSLVFSLALTGRAERALHRRHKLAVTVKLTLAPRGGSATTTVRSLVLRA